MCAVMQLVGEGRVPSTRHTQRHAMEVLSHSSMTDAIVSSEYSTSADVLGVVLVGLH